MKYASLLALLAAAGCAVGPDYQRPAADLTTRFVNGDAASVGQVAADRWWLDYQDATLNDLVARGLDQNLDVLQAIEVINQARANLRATGINAQASGGIDAAGTESGGTAINGTVDGSSAELGAAYVIDIFGGYRRERQAAEDSIRAENDRLATEYVELKRAGMIVDRVPLDDIVTDRLVRDRKAGPDEDLAELKDSIRDIGLSNPVRLERRADGKFELVQGMRRLLAYRALREETGAALFDAIPAGIGAQEAQAQVSYRRMVDENLIRKDISFAEMAILARRYAEDPANDCPEVSEAVAVLYKSASYTKRSYIRAFAELVTRLDKVLQFPEQIPRNLGVDLKRRMDGDDGLVARIATAMRAEPGRDGAREVEILRGFLTASDGTLPAGKTDAAKPVKARQAKTTFQVPVDTGVAKCSASAGRLEMRHDVDFSSVDRRSLERAVAAFFAALEADAGSDSSE